MYVKRKYQWMFALPFFAILLSLGCSGIFYGATYYTRDAPAKFFTGWEAINVEESAKIGDMERRFLSHDLTLDEVKLMARQRQAKISSRISIELADEADAADLHYLYYQCFQVFAFITLAVSSFAILYYIFLYTKSSTLLSFLKSRGYDSLTLRDAAMIYFSVRKLAFTLPDAATVLVLPGYSPDPDSLIRYLRDHANYKLQQPSPS